MEVFAILLIYFLVIKYDLYPTIKEGFKKEAIIYSILLLISFSMLISHALGAKLPIIGNYIQSMVNYVFKLKN